MRQPPKMCSASLAGGIGHSDELLALRASLCNMCDTVSPGGLIPVYHKLPGMANALHLPNLNRLGGIFARF